MGRQIAEIVRGDCVGDCRMGHLVDLPEGGHATWAVDRVSPDACRTQLGVSQTPTHQGTVSGRLLGMDPSAAARRAGGTSSASTLSWSSDREGCRAPGPGGGVQRAGSYVWRPRALRQ